MRKIIFVTGGQRSGKSAFAQNLAESLSAHRIYLATARHWDEDFDKRIRLHQEARGSGWETLEEEKHLSRNDLSGKVVLLDCITLWLTNIYHDNEYKMQPTLSEAKEEWNKFIEQDFTLIVVSNEIGMGLHPIDESTRHFADIHGWINQHVASSADEVYLTVSGIPVRIK